MRKRDRIDLEGHEDCTIINNGEAIADEDVKERKVKKTRVSADKAITRASPQATLLAETGRITRRNLKIRSAAPSKQLTSNVE